MHINDTPMELDPQQLLSALSDATRLRIVALLVNHHELCVCRLVDALDAPQPRISKHLAVLRGNGVIIGRRVGQWIHYRIHEDLPAWASQAIEPLIQGCAARSPYRDDEARLAGQPLSLSSCA